MCGTENSVDLWYMLFEVEIGTAASLRVSRTAFMTLYRNTYRIESTRLRDWDYGSPGWYFVTVCTQKRACFFGGIKNGNLKLSLAGQIADSELQNISFHYSNVRLDLAIVMPNHVHAIIAIDGRGCYSAGLGADGVPDVPKLGAPATPKFGALATKMLSLSSIVRSYKAGVTRLCKTDGFQNFAWQPRFYDHVLRTNASVNAVRDYIQNNPANWIHDKDNPKNQTAR